MPNSSSNINRLIYVIILSVFFIPYLSSNLSDIHILPRQAILVIELLFAATFVLVAFKAGLSKAMALKPKYILLFMLLCLHVTAGALLNGDQPGAVLAGMRNYFKYAPLFLLPAVFSFTDDDFRKQLKLLLLLAFLQVPLVIAQKIHNPSAADNIAGTFIVGSILAFYLLGVMGVTIGLYYRNCISIKKLIFVLVVFIIPLTLNETKSFIILLPAVFLTATFASGIWRKKKLQFIGSLAILSLLLGVFSLVYDQLFSVAGKEGLLGFYTNFDQGAESYLYTGEAEKIDAGRLLRDKSPVIGAAPVISPGDTRLRRGDSIILSFRTLAHDPTKLFFGLGIGNASESIINKLSGKYSFLSADIGTPLITVLLWETGIFGLMIFLTFFIFIFFDAYYLAHQSNLTGAFAIGWCGIVVMVILSLPYKDFMVFYPVSTLFWYFSGYLAARRCQIERKLVNPTTTMDAITTPKH